MKRRFAPLVLAVVFALALCACAAVKTEVSTDAETKAAPAVATSGDSLTESGEAKTEANTETETETQIETETETQTETETETETEAPGVDPALVDVGKRELILNDHCDCGVMYLGFDSELGSFADNRAGYEKLFRDSGAWEAFDFVHDFPADRYVEVGKGYELYLIIPPDYNSKIVVNEWLVNEDNGFVGEKGKEVFSSESGAPILIRCNENEIVSNALITVTASSGDEMSFNLQMSMMDGNLITVYDLKYLYDFTRYDLLYPNRED